MFSIWEKNSFNSSVDLAVVGAGITGLFTALHYKRDHPGHVVMVLERGSHPIGASVKNAGFACFGSPSELLHDIATEGSDIALERVEERWRGLLELRAELGDRLIGFEPVGGYELFPVDTSLYSTVADGFDELNRALFDIMGKMVFTWEDERIKQLELHAGHLCFNAMEGALDSGLLMRALLDKTRSEGVDVRFNSTVAGWEDTNAGVQLRLTDGQLLSASRAVFATNGFTRDLLPQCDVLPARGQVMLTSEIPGLQLKGTFHIHAGYYYFRHFHGRVLLGGGRELDKAGEATMDEGTTPKIQAALEEMLHNVILPGKTFTIDQRWSGVMGFRAHGGPPLVNIVSPHAVLAAGLGGIGVAIGIRIAHRAAELAGSL
ncbi:MAG: FAD-dependent oxidoreductase [Flavobacteriales bacterium]